MKNDALAIVPLNIDKLEATKVNRDRIIRVDEKKTLMDILRKKMSENRCLLEARKNEVQSDIIEKEKEKVNLAKFRADLDAIDEQITALRNRKETIETRCENATGFSIEGNLLAVHASGYGRNDDSNKLWDIRHRQGLNKANAIRNKIEIAQKFVERFGLKFDKVETRLVLATTIGEAMDIMEAVLGNGDVILNAEDVKEVDE